MMEQVKGKWIIYKKNKAYVSALILDNNLEKIQIEPCVHHQIGSIYIGKIQKIDDYGQFHTLWKAGKNFTVLPGIDSFVIIHNNFG